MPSDCRYLTGNGAVSLARVAAPVIQSHQRYEELFAEVEAPFAFVDLDAMWANADAMLARAGDKRVRVATKSLRCRALIEAVLRRDRRFAGLMTFTLPETLWLAEQGFDDLLLAYPTADLPALEELALRSAARPDAAPIVTVDCVEHLEAIESVLASHRAACEASRAAVAHLGLDDLLPGNRRGPLPLHRSSSGNRPTHSRCNPRGRRSDRPTRHYCCQ